MNNRVLWVMMTALTIACVRQAALAGPLQETNSPFVRTYAVGKQVSDFPTAEDLSTPETAYAFFNRALASGDQAVWGRLSIASIARHFPPNAKPEKVSASVADERLNTGEIEVHI